MKNLIKKLLYQYTYNLKLTSKLLISHGILLLLPTAVVTGFFYARLYNVIISNSIASEQAMAFQAMNSIENLMDTAVHTTDTVNGTGLVRDLLNPALEETLNDPMAYEKRFDRLYNLTSSLKDGNFITDIRIYCDDQLYSQLSSLNRESRPLLIPLSLAGSWKDSLPATREHMLFSDSLLSEAERELGDLAVVNQIGSDETDTSLEAPKTSAFVAVYLSRELLEESLSGSLPIPEAITYLVNEQDQLVAASAGFSFTYFIPHSQLGGQIGKEGIFSLVSFPDGPAYSAYFPIQYTDWYMVSILPSAHITAGGIRLLLEFVMIYLLFTALAVWIALILSRSIAKRIIGVALQMEHSVRSGKPHPITGRPSGQDEIGILSDTYNYMALELDRLMEQEKKSSEELRKAEFLALQAQINPHFLYNTLDMINWLSKTGRTQDVTSAIQALSRFYKLTLSKGSLVNTIRAELEHVSLYVQLQNMRYDNCAHLTVDVPEELYSYTIPKLTFQPIVENALLHGIRMTEEKQGTILIIGWFEKGDMVFIISDDGAGMTGEQLKTLQDELDTEPSASSDSRTRGHWQQTGSQKRDAGPDSHIGVYNTNLRLKSLYGVQYGLSYESFPGRGTEVTIRLPAKREE